MRTQVEEGVRELERLERLIDGVFALIIVMIVLDLPQPQDFSVGALREFLLERLYDGVSILIGCAVVLIYWLQSNVLYGSLRRTDSKHASLAILQIVALLLYLYVLGVGADAGAVPVALAAQSIVAALVGFVAGAGWAYASRRRRLLLPEIGSEQVRALLLWNLAEPLTALFTLPFAFVGAMYWELSWLAYPVFSWILGKTALGGPKADR